MALAPRKDKCGRRKSDPGTAHLRSLDKAVVSCDLPWGGTRVVALPSLDLSQPSGPFVGKAVLLDLLNLFQRKLTSVVDDEPIEKLLNKTLQRGGDAYFDNVCTALHEVCEVCLPAVLNVLLTWHEKTEEHLNGQHGMTLGTEQRLKLMKKTLAVNYLFCLVLIEILPQVEFHATTCDPMVKKILETSFRHVQYKDPASLGPNNTNQLVVAETYSEVIGVLSLTHFSHIHRIFMSHILELKKESTVLASHQVIALIMAMKFVKIKTNQVEAFEMGIKFLDDLGSYLLELKDKDVKHAVTGLLVEILLPVAAQIKSETNIPALISLVQKLYIPTTEMASKKQHKLAAYPLQTCLLCVSQRHFFLTNWVPFLNVTLANLKNRDSKISRVALESLYRLLWVYMIRNNADGNTATRSRLESVCGSLFPKGNRAIVPRDAPLNIFVKIIHFIAQQKLDFAFKEIIFDLLCCNRSQRSLYAERMNIGIRALMVIADGLQQKDEPPPMPKSMGPSASGTIQKQKKKTYITRPLTLEIARSIGLDQYYTPCKKAFDGILRTLDTQIGKPYMMPTVQGRGKEPEELFSGDAKPKLDLFRTCVAAIPRLLPDPMGPSELIDILTRLTVHVDEELRNMAGLTLQTIIGEFPEWREHVFLAQLSLLQNQISDFYPQVLDDALRLLFQLLSTWKAAVIAEKKRDAEKTVPATPKSGHTQLPSLPECSPLPPQTPTGNSSIHSTGSVTSATINTVLHSIEGMAIVYLCQTRPQPRKLAINLLKEVKTLSEILNIENSDTPVITVLDNATPYVVRKYIEHVPLSERLSWNMEFASVCEKISSIEVDNYLVNSDRGNEYFQWDPWACALSGYAEVRHLLTKCPTAVTAAWPILFTRLNAVSGYVDPNNPQNESRASLLRGSKSKASSVCGEPLGQDGCLSLWQKYLILCCALAPSPHLQAASFARSFSPTNSMDGPSDVLRSVSASLRSARAPVPTSLSQFLSKICTILRWENMTDIRDSVVLGAGSINPLVFETLLEELKSCGIMREACEKKLETNLRRRRRKDLLRLQILRTIEVAVFRGLLRISTDSSGALNPTIADFIDCMRLNLENDHDRDVAIVTQLRLHLAKLVALIIDSTSVHARNNLLTMERRSSFFYLFMSWCSKAIAADRKCRDKEFGSYVEQKSVIAMTRILCCGQVLEPNKSIGEEGFLCQWLEKLVTSNNPVMQSEVEPMLACMLELNESSNLLDWLMAQCYSQTPTVSARCFRALVHVFSRRDFPCEFVSLFVLCQAMLAVPEVANCAVLLIEILKKQFLNNNAASTTSPAVSLRSTTEVIGTTTCPHSIPIDQLEVCSRLAKCYPHLTVTIFSEVSFRLESSSWPCRVQLLSLLQPWITNLELVDKTLTDEALEGPRGWGSEEATQLVLNNLLHLTATLSADHERQLGELWKCLAIGFPANLPAILNFFYTATTMSQEQLLPIIKRLCVIISQVAGTRLSTLLVEWLAAGQDNTRMSLERTEIPPYYRWCKWRDDTVERKESKSQTPRDEDLDKDDASRDGVRVLPMPAYGGHYSQLSTFLPPATQPVQFFTKSEVALLLICDTIRAPSGVDWAESTPLLLHAGVLSLDSLRPILCRHARQVIINVIFLFVEKQYLPQLSAILLKNEMVRGGEMSDVDGDAAVGVARGESPSFAKATAEEYRKLLSTSAFLFSSVGDLLSAIVFCLSESMDLPLWENEDATPRNWRVASAAKLSHLVEHVVEAMHSWMPMLPIMWTQLAMRMALATPHRHLAGRCFQIVSALQQPPGAWLPSLMSRLVETAGEQHEETQSYVTDLLVCIIDCAVHISPYIEGVIMRTSMSPTHHRSTSYTPALVRQSVICSRVQNHQDRKDARLSLLVSDKDKWTTTETLIRSKSADQLKSDMEADEEINSRMQMCAIAISLLESGIDNEFLLALQLLEKVLDTSQQQKLASLQKLEKIVAQLEWKNYSGVVALVSRGAVLPTAYEPSIQAMIRVCDILGEDIIGGHDSISLLVCHTLPYLLLNFETPNSLCTSVANAISVFCNEEVGKVDGPPVDHPFIHLATVMNQYSTKTFTKDAQQFARCVLQYICDGVIALDMDAILCLLSEMLERGWVSLQGFVLHMMFLLVQHNHTASLSPLSVNAQVIRSVSRHLQGIHWKEASKVYKAVVEKWNSENRLDDSLLDFSIELGPVLASTTTSLVAAPQPHAPSASGTNSPRKGTVVEQPPIVTTTSNGFGASTSLKRLPPPHMRVRDRLVGILSASGLRIGLPSATSLVFSRSELGSAASSTERVCASSQEVASTISLPDPTASITDSFPRVFKEFDFLDAEHDSVSETTDSCFWWLSTMRQKKKEEGEEQRREEEEEEEEEEEDNYDESESRDVSEKDDVRRSVRSSSTEEADEDDEKTPCPSEGCRSEEDGDDVEIEDDAFDGERSSLGDHREHLLSTSQAPDVTGDGSSSICDLMSSVSMPVEYYGRNKNLRIQCQHHIDLKVQQDFVHMVGELNDDSDGDLTAHTTLLATLLYKACCSNVCALLRDASQLLTSKALTRSFATTQETLAKVVDFPYLFVTEQFIRGSSLLQKLKLSIFELREHYETFDERREQCQKALNSLRSAYKLTALGGSTSSMNAISEADVAKTLNKLVFQVMLMSDSLKDMTDAVKNSTNSQTFSLSPAILEHHRELLMCASDDVSQNVARFPSNNSQHTSDSVVLLLANKRYAQALNVIRQLRSTYGNEFGCCETVDIDVLLLLFCRSHSLKAWAVVGASAEEIIRHSELLRDVNADLASSIRRAVHTEQRTPSTMSSATESFSQISKDTSNFS